MLQALEQQLGIVTAACKQVGIDRKTHYRWLQADPDYKEACDQIPDIILDFAENQLYKQIKEGNITATIFFLKTRGKERGYIERIQTQDVSDKPKQLVIVRESKTPED